MIGTGNSLAALAVGALVDEVVLTPKPGLVDRRGPGSHDDMDLDLLLASAAALEPAFVACAELGASLPVGQRLRECLGSVGREGETAMLAATGGVNTHRGALWALGLLTAAAAAATGVLSVVQRAAAIARTPDRPSPSIMMSHGAEVRARYSVAGAPGEARAAFPHVTGHALPILRRARAAGADEPSARLDALLALMAVVDDTCLLYRGGHPGLRSVQSAAASVLAAGGTATSVGRRRFGALDRLCRPAGDRGLSPGGSADLLAVTLFLDRLASGEPCRP